MIDSKYVERHATLHELPGEGGRTGRHVLHDVRSRDFPAERAQKIVDVLHNAQGLPLNQLDVGSCTAEALTGAGNSDPNLPAGQAPRTQDDAYHLYSVETALEGQPWPPNDPGGSGLMVCRAAKQLGWIKSYKHAFGLQHALEALVLRPVIFGVAWYSSFDTPDPTTGVVEIAKRARVRGGHEILADEIDVTNELVGFWQSWGPWGLNGTGKFYMPFKVVDQLLVQQGDCTVPTFA